MKQLYPIIVLLLFFAGILFFVRYRSDVNLKKVQEMEEQHTRELKQKKEAETKAVFEHIKSKADSALVFCKEKRFDTSFCILVDFKVHSGKDRFFIWDFKSDTILYAGLCAHGYGMNSTSSRPVFSNVPGSYCSSLGKYKIGARYVSNWGIKIGYLLHGLEESNNNALKRKVVIHSYGSIPSGEIYPTHLPLGYSQGCTVISNELMRQADELLKEATKPVLLWIYY
jgi:hypothetical protein